MKDRTYRLYVFFPFFSLGICILLFTTPNLTNADTLGSILSAVNAISSYEQGSQFGALNNITSSIGQLQTQLLQSIQNQIGVQITGTYGLGNLNWNQNPSLSYLGDNNDSWENILQIYQNGGNPGELSSVISNLNQQFPIQSDLSTVSNVNPEVTNQNYYTVQAQTSLASRAASQVAYDNIEKEITYEQILQQQIDKTTNIKAALDLQNRLQVENNLIQLQILKLDALSNQQQAIEEQGSVNAAVNNADFFNSP